MLVNNDDLVRAGTGYDDHPHRDAEIITWVLSGSLVHQDSQGHSGIVYPGLAQRMSAGSGIVHAERNDAYRIDPTRAMRAGALRADVAAARRRPAASRTTSSARSFSTTSVGTGSRWLRAGTRMPRSPWAVPSRPSGSPGWPRGSSRRLPAGPRLHVYLAAGEVEIESVGRLSAGDAARLTGRSELLVTGVGAAELLVWELAA